MMAPTTEGDSVFEVQSLERVFSASSGDGKAPGGSGRDRNGRIWIGNVDIPRGSRVAILGESGRGKSTLMKFLGLLDWFSDQDGGRIVYNQRDPASGKTSPVDYRALSRDGDRSRLRRQDFGLVFQSDELLDHLDLNENIHLVSMLNGGTPDLHTSADGLDALDVIPGPKANPADLSGGERTRVSVLRAIQHDPELLLVDEPASDLDPDLRYQVMHLLTDWHSLEKDRRTLIFVTHDLAMAWELADTFIVFPSIHSTGLIEELIRKGLIPDNRRPVAPGTPGAARELGVVVRTKAELKALAESLRGAAGDEETPGGEDAANGTTGASRQKAQEGYLALCALLGWSHAQPWNHEDRWLKWVSPEEQRCLTEGKRDVIQSFVGRLPWGKPKKKGIGPGSFGMLAFRDFWRRNRSEKAFFLSRGAPILLLAVSFILFASLLIISGYKSGTDEQFRAELSSPLLWAAELHADRPLQGQEITDLTRAMNDREKILRSRIGFLAGDHEGDETFLTGAESYDIAASFRNPTDSARRADFQSVRMLTSQNPVLDWVVGAMDAAPEDRETIRKDGDRFEGVILSRELVQDLYPELKEGRPRWVEISHATRDPDTDEVTSVYLPTRVLGVASRLPRTQAMMSVGFEYTRTGSESFIKTSSLAVVVQPTPTPEDLVRMEAALASRLEAGLNRASEQAWGHPLREPLQCSVRYQLEVTSGDAKPYFQVTMSTGNGTEQKVFIALVSRVVGDLGKDPADDLLARYKWSPDFGMLSDGRVGLQARPKNQSAQHWMKVLPSTMDDDDFESLVALMGYKKVLVDTSLGAKVSSQRKLRAIFLGFAWATFSGALILFVLLLAVFLTFDSYRKVHSIGVFLALGASRRLYLMMILAQSVILEIVALGLAAVTVLLLGRWLPGISGSFMSAASGTVGKDAVSLSFHLTAGDWISVGLVWVGVVALSLLIRWGIFCRKHPAHQMGY